jgi:hypothetical protein
MAVTCIASRTKRLDDPLRSSVKRSMSRRLVSKAALLWPLRCRVLTDLIRIHLLACTRCERQNDGRQTR